MSSVNLVDHAADSSEHNSNSLINQSFNNEAICFDEIDHHSHSNLNQIKSQHIDQIDKDQDKESNYNNQDFNQAIDQSNLTNHFQHSKSLIHRRQHDLFNQQLYHHHRQHFQRLNQKCNHHYQCVVYANLIRNQQLKKDQKKKKNKRKLPKKLKRKKKRTFTKEPPDGGYGWWIVFASFLISLIADGISFSFGMIYVELVKFFGQSKSKTAWVGSLFFAMPLLAGPIASALTDRYGCRLTTIASGLIAFTGFFISSFVQSLEFLYLTFSLTGIGLALCYVSGIVIVAHYFEKKRSLATGLAVCGTGIGTFVFPPLTNYFLNSYQWQKTLIIISCFFLVIMLCGFMIKDLNLEEIDESENYKERKSNKQQKLKTKASKLIEQENSDLSTKFKDVNGNFHKTDLNLRSENVHLLNNVNIKNANNLVKNQAKLSNQTSLVTSSSEDSYSLDSESCSSSSSSDESKSSSTPDLRTMSDFNEKLSDQFDKFDSILCSKCEDEDDVFESNQLTSCNDLSSTILNNLGRSNSTICLPTYLDAMYDTLDKESNNSLMQKSGIIRQLSENPSTSTNTNLIIKHGSEADQFHKDILLNLQKKFYFYKLIYVYPYLFPECCRKQHCEFIDQIDRINQTVHSDKDLFISKSKPIKPCIHSFSCDYDLKYEDCDTSMKCESIKNDSKQNSLKKNLINSAKNVEFMLNGTKLNEKCNPSINKNISNSLSPTTSTITTSTTTTSTTNLITNHKNILKPLPNKSVGQSLISSFVLEPGSYFRHMKFDLKRDSISYRSAMLNTPRYRLKSSSCPNIYRNSLLSLNGDHSKTNLFSTLKYLKYFICDIFDTSLLQDYRFALFCISNSCLYACIDVPYIYLYEYAIQKGTSEKMASYLISVIGIVNTLGIVIVGYVGDKTWIKTSNLYSLFTTISGFSIFFLPLVHAYEGFAILAAIYGFSISVNYTLITVILIDILSIERFTTGYGFLLLVQGCSTLFGPPLAGWLFDISGSFNLTFYITGLCIIFSGVIVLPIDNKSKCNWIFLNKYNKTKNSPSQLKNGLNSLDKCLNHDKDKSFSNLLNA